MDSEGPARPPHTAPPHAPLPRPPPPSPALSRPPSPSTAFHSPPLPSPACLSRLRRQPSRPATWRTLNMQGGVKAPLKLATSSRPWQISAASASAAAAPGPGAATPLPALLRGIKAEAAGSCGEAALARARKGLAQRRWPGRTGALVGSGWRSALSRSGRAGPMRGRGTRTSHGQSRGLLMPLRVSSRTGGRTAASTPRQLASPS